MKKTRLLKLRKIDAKVLKILLIVRRRGTVTITSIAVATTQGLVKKTKMKTFSHVF